MNRKPVVSKVKAPGKKMEAILSIKKTVERIDANVVGHDGKSFNRYEGLRRLVMQGNPSKSSVAKIISILESMKSQFDTSASDWDQMMAKFRDSVMQSIKHAISEELVSIDARLKGVEKVSFPSEFQETPPPARPLEETS